MDFQFKHLLLDDVVWLDVLGVNPHSFISGDHKIPENKTSLNL
jgi:hypothetical protein